MRVKTRVVLWMTVINTTGNSSGSCDKEQSCEILRSRHDESDTLPSCNFTKVLQANIHFTFKFWWDVSRLSPCSSGYYVVLGNCCLSGPENNVDHFIVCQWWAVFLGCGLWGPGFTRVARYHRRRWCLSELSRLIRRSSVSPSSGFFKGHSRLSRWAVSRRRYRPQSLALFKLRRTPVRREFYVLCRQSSYRHGWGGVLVIRVHLLRERAILSFLFCNLGCLYSLYWIHKARW